MKKILFASVLIIFLSGYAGSAFANDSATANAAVNSDVAATLDARNFGTSINESKRPFTQAVPGTGSYLYSGWPMEGTSWQVYCPPVYKNLTKEQTNNMKRKFQVSDLWPWNWKDRIHTSKIEDSPSKDVASISCVKYWPKAVAYDEDKVFRSVRVEGDPRWNEEAYMGLAYSVCWDESPGTERVAMRRRMLKDGVTDGKSIGGGVSHATMGGEGGNESTAVIGGGQIGKNRTKVEDYVDFEVLCMNGGKTEADESWFLKKEEPKPVSQPQVIINNIIPPAPLPAPTGLRVIPGSVAVDPCASMPEVAVNFDFDKYNLKSSEMPKIEIMADFLKANPGCKVQLDGNCSKEGTPEYNAVLGRNRAVSVDKTLKAKGVSNIVEFVSASKDFPVSVQQPKNRRVIMRAVGISSEISEKK